MKYAIIVMALTACTVPDRKYTGPTIMMQLTNNGTDSIQDSDSMPSFTLFTGDTQYSIDVEVFTQEGMVTNGNTDSSSQVTGATATVTLGTMSLPAPALQSDQSILDPTYKSTMPIVIPASSMGMTLKIHATGTDNNGLASNVIDMQVALM